MQLFSQALSDIGETGRRLPLLSYFAWSDTKARYKRSVLGPFWLVITTAIGVGGLGFLWSTIFNIPPSILVPSLTVGIIVWQLIANTIAESASVYIKDRKIIRNIKTPYFLFPLQLVIRNLINFAHNLVVIVVVLIIFPPEIGMAQIYIVPGILLLIGNLLWISGVIAILGTRYRDIEQLIISVMPLLFFMSPVIYKPDQLGAREAIIWFNPFSYLIGIVRDPIQGVIPELWIYAVSMAMLLLGWLCFLWLLDRKYTRIAYWV